MPKASPNLLALDKMVGDPISLLRTICDTLSIPYSTPTIKEGDRVCYEHEGVSLDPFAEPNSIFFKQEDGTLVFFEVLTKIIGMAGRIAGRYQSVDITSAPILDYKGTWQGGCRVLLRVGHYETIYIHFESWRDSPAGVGTSEFSAHLPNPLPRDNQEDVAEVFTKFSGEGFTQKMESVISVWNF